MKLPASLVKAGAPAAVLKDPVRLSVGEEGLTGNFSIKLPALLEKRRKEFAIPDCCFGRVAMFDRVLVFQITEEDADKVSPGSRLFRPESAQDRALKEAPRGVIITGGLAALDYLWANGAGLGSVINFVRLSPWRMPVGFIKGTEIQLHVMRVGDIVACEDMATEDYYVALDEIKALHQLRIDGKLRPRADVNPSDDY